MKENTHTSDRYARSLDDADCNFSFTQEQAKKFISKVQKNRTIEIYVHQDSGDAVITLDVAKSYGIPYIGLSIALILWLLLIYKILSYSNTI
jgi:hypothetical protein